MDDTAPHDSGLDTLKLLRDIRRLAESCGFETSQYGHVAGFPLLAFERTASVLNAEKVYLSSGIHGDEPAGPLAIHELLRERALPPTHHYWLCPVINPWGLQVGKRENAAGLDLNRDYTEGRSNEINSHIRWAGSRLRALDLCLHLHEDWESAGFYLYELNFSDAPGKAQRILEASRAHLPVETAPEIDGHSAVGGIIRPETLPEVEHGDPEAIYFQKHFSGLNYTLETPSALPISRRVAALKAAVLAALFQDSAKL